MPAANQQRFLDVTAAANYLGIGKSLFYELLKERAIPAVYIRSKRLFDVKILDEIADAIVSEQLGEKGGPGP